MPSGRLATSLDAGGVSINKGVTRTGDGAIGLEVSLPAGKPGQLTTRTDNETGTLTMESGHGITTGAIIDLYWDGGSRHGILVGTVSSNSVPIGADDAGTGDNLPTNLTNIVACVQVVITETIDGDALVCLAVCLESTSNSGKGYVEMLDDGPASIAALDLVANVPKPYDIEGGADNPFTGNVIVSMVASNGHTTDATLKINGFKDTTP